MSYEHLFIKSLIITELIEVPIVFLLARYLYKKSEIKRVVVVATVATALTLPYLWFILPVYLSDRFMYILVGEILVFVVEALIYYFLIPLKFHQGILVSFAANLISFSVGLIINIL